MDERSGDEEMSGLLASAFGLRPLTLSFVIPMFKFVIPTEGRNLLFAGTSRKQGLSPELRSGSK